MKNNNSKRIIFTQYLFKINSYLHICNYYYHACMHILFFRHWSFFFFSFYFRVYLAWSDCTAADRDKFARNHIQHADTAGDRRLPQVHLLQRAAIRHILAPGGSNQMDIPGVAVAHGLQSLLWCFYYWRGRAVRDRHPSMRIYRWVISFHLKKNL